MGAAARGEPTILVLEGEAGIGKTRLAGEAIDTSRSLGFTVLAGGGHPVEAAPYSAWRTVCGEALGFDTIVDPGRAGPSPASSVSKESRVDRICPRCSPP